MPKPQEKSEGEVEPACGEQGDSVESAGQERVGRGNARQVGSGWFLWLMVGWLPLFHGLWLTGLQGGQEVSRDISQVSWLCRLTVMVACRDGEAGVMAQR